ncbi:MAG: hypothetical protein EBY62_02320 [Cellvibrionales bacterium]|nr:hypothetical protein [Cellvibrionales bacterium]
MTRSELIELMASRQDQLSAKDVYREPRRGRNPKTGDAVDLEGKHVPHFKPGKELRERVNRSLKTGF